jgi:aromatic ring-opening dioxygenase LigB subunit
MLKFACISPHPPIILPSVGSKEDRKQVKKTIENLEFLGKKLSGAEPDAIIISSPHPDWGFNVPLRFLAQGFKGEIQSILIGLESPRFYYEEGKKVYNSKFNPSTTLRIDGERGRTIKIQNSKFAIIASGDLSHCLKSDGPYGFNPDGPKFDKDLIEALQKKDIKKILKLDDLYPEAAECGLRSFCFLLGILEASKMNWQPEILSYEGPFGVGYLVANFKLQ